MYGWRRYSRCASRDWSWRRSTPSATGPGRSRRAGQGRRPHGAERAGPAPRVAYTGARRLAGVETLRARARRNGERIVAVTFLLGGRPVGTDTTAPFELDVDASQLPTGRHRLGIEAVDRLGRRKAAKAGARERHAAGGARDPDRHARNVPPRAASARGRARDRPPRPRALRRPAPRGGREHAPGRAPGRGRCSRPPPAAGR